MCVVPLKYIDLLHHTNISYFTQHVSSNLFHCCAPLLKDACNIFLLKNYRNLNCYKNYCFPDVLKWHATFFKITCNIFLFLKNTHIFIFIWTSFPHELLKVTRLIFLKIMRNIFLKIPFNNFLNLIMIYYNTYVKMVKWSQNNYSY